MEGHNDSHSSLPSTRGASLSQASTVRGTPPAQRFSSLGDAHFAITSSSRRQGASSANNNNNNINNNEGLNSMPLESSMTSSSSGFNPALTIPPVHLTSASASASASGSSLNNTTPAAVPAAMSVLPAASATSAGPNLSSTPNLSLPVPTSLPFARDGAISRQGFRDGENEQDTTTFTTTTEESDLVLDQPTNTEPPHPHHQVLHHRPLAMPLPVDAQPQGREEDALPPTLPSVASMTNPPALLRDEDPETQEGENENVAHDVTSGGDQQYSLSEAFERSSDRSATASNSDPYSDPFYLETYVQPDSRTFIQRNSEERAISQALHIESTEIGNNFSRATLHHAGTTNSHYYEDQIPPLPHMHVSPENLDRVPTLTTRQEAARYRAPAPSLVSSPELNPGYMGFQSPPQNRDTGMGHNGVQSPGEWETVVTSGFGSNRVYASRGLPTQSPLDRFRERATSGRIGRLAGSSLADNSDAGDLVDEHELTNLQADLPMGANMGGFSSSQHALLTRPAPTHGRMGNQSGTQREINRAVGLFPPMPRTHRVNGSLPFNPNRDFTMRLGSSRRPSSRFLFRGSGDYDNLSDQDDNNRAQEAEPPSTPTRVSRAPESRYARLNRHGIANDSNDPSSAGWTNIDLGANDSRDRNASSNANRQLAVSGHSTFSIGPATPTTPPHMLGCALVDRETFARRQAARRASGEDDQTYLDRNGRRLTTPAPAAIQHWHQENQDPFDTVRSTRTLPRNADGTGSFEMVDLGRPYPLAHLRAEAGGPSLAPIEERRRRFYFNADSDAPVSLFESDFERNFMSQRGIRRRTIWYYWLLCWSCIPFIALWAYNSRHDTALSWFTGGETNRLTPTQRRNIGLCGCLSFLFLLVIAMLIAVLVAHGVVQGR